MTAPVERFWNKVRRDTSTECWTWTGSLKSPGYGRLWVDGKNELAHRFAYELLVGPIPNGLVIDHLCRNRACVNPEHLEPVAHRVNTIRGIGPTAVNAHKAECPQQHPYDEENTLVINGRRYCRECRRQRNIQWRARRGPERLAPEKRARKAELQRLRRAAERAA